MGFFGGKDVRKEELAEALNTLVDRVNRIEKRLTVIEERYETLEQEQSEIGGEATSTRKRLNEFMSDAGSKVNTLVIDTGKLKEDVKHLESRIKDKAEKKDLVEVKKKAEMKRW